jgi:glycosyltransferase involved in cell wall biosynthesis
MMRIALISEHASPLATLGGVDSGGQNVYVGQIARHLAAFGHEVDVFTRRDDEGLRQVEELGERVRVVHLGAGPPSYVRKEELLPFMDEFAAEFLRFSRRSRGAYDIIHANFFMSALVAAEAKGRLGTPFVVTFHALGRVRRLHQGGSDTFPEDRLAIEDRVVAEADHIIAECPQDFDDLTGLYGADPERVSIVPCGFDPDEFWPVPKHEARSALGLPADERIILQLGRMVPRKGVETVIRALAVMRREYELEARLLVVGGESEDPDPKYTPEIGRLRAIAAGEGVEDLVTFVGRRGRHCLRNYYCAADVFATTPWYEPFGITPVESMACGTPVIGSDVGGIKTTVRHGETGYLVPPNDPASLADRMAQLYEHPRRLAEFSRRAVRRANEYYTWKRVAFAVEGLYEQVLNDGRVLAARGAETVGAGGLRDVIPWRPAPAGPAQAPADLLDSRRRRSLFLR